MNEILTGQDDPMMNKIEQARLAAVTAQGATVEEGIDPASGSDTVRIEAGRSTIQAANEFQADTIHTVADSDLRINTSRVESSTERTTPKGGVVKYSAVVTTHNYPDGDSFSHGRTTIHRTGPDGKETIRNSSNPERAKYLTKLIAKKIVADADKTGKTTS